MSKISIKVIPRSSKIEVEKLSEGEYRVRLTKAPADNEANEQLVKILSKHFGVAPSLIRVISGLTSRKKIVEIS